MLLLSLVLLELLCWVSACLRRSTFLWKALPQAQEKGLNPVCLREWVIKLDDWEKLFPQVMHWWGFSPLQRTKGEQSKVLKIFVQVYLLEKCLKFSGTCMDVSVLFHVRFLMKSLAAVRTRIRPCIRMYK